MGADGRLSKQDVTGVVMVDPLRAVVVVLAVLAAGVGSIPEPERSTSPEPELLSPMASSGLQTHPCQPNT